MKKRILKILILVLISIKSFSQGIDILDIPEKIINSTTLIQFYKDSINFSGTGFFFLFKLPNSKICPAIVTNYHVIKDAFENNKSITLTFNRSNGTIPNYGDTISYKLLYDKHPRQKELIIRHRDNNVDLAIILLYPIIREIEKQHNCKPFFICYNEDDIPNINFLNNITAIEEVFMIGYPKFIFDSYNYLPIVRRGITATSINHNFDNKNQFLLDIPIYPGSSGSPVILYKKGAISDKNGNVKIGGIDFALLGIQVQSFDPPTQLKPYNVNVNLPINLAIVIKSVELLSFKPLIEKLIKMYPNIQYVSN